VVPSRGEEEGEKLKQDHRTIQREVKTGRHQGRHSTCNSGGLLHYLTFELRLRISHIEFFFLESLFEAGVFGSGVLG
jgi:hypothetical protein